MRFTASQEHQKLRQMMATCLLLYWGSLHNKETPEAWMEMLTSRLSPFKRFHNALLHHGSATSDAQTLDMRTRLYYFSGPIQLGTSVKLKTNYCTSAQCSSLAYSLLQRHCYQCLLGCIMNNKRNAILLIIIIVVFGEPLVTRHGAITSIRGFHT